MNLPRALMTFVGLLMYHKTLDVFVRVLGERDFFENGHSNFVHSLKEGLIIVDDLL